MDIEALRAAAVAFRDERRWARFHDPKNLALALSIEAAELAEIFLWKSDAEVEALVGSVEGRKRLGEEMADVLIYLLLFSDRAGINLPAAVLDKLEQNRRKYPIEKSIDSNRKYTDLA